MELHLHPSPDHISDVLRSGRFYEDFIFYEFEKYINEGGTWLDIGANIGNHTMMFKQRWPDQKIICFEGNPLNYILLYKNALQFSNIEPICIGLSDSNRLEHFISPDINYGGGGILPNPGNKYPTIPVVVNKLDDFNLKDITFIKMDVENHELYVIKGGYKTISEYKPMIWIEDFFFDNEREKSPVSYLEKEFGYKLINRIEDNFLLSI
jgi:FkbM family methyltransferase